uniref:Uncharacterized protein n=1 Tax=Rhodnius prolixus TaxID=13249 RepID=T1I940_RHOPR
MKIFICKVNGGWLNMALYWLWEVLLSC